MSDADSAVPAVTHGGAPRGWLELSANLNPRGTPFAVRDAIAAATYESYADLDAGQVEAHLAEQAGVPASHVLVTAGATEALRLACEAILHPGDDAVVLGPAYGELAREAALRGARVREVRAREPQFLPPLDELVAAAEGARAVLLCDPNNPTAMQLTGDELGRLPSRLGGRTLILDQSFLPFGRATVDLATLAEGGVIVLRSLTKVLAIPGVRIGYAVAAPRILERMRERKDPWSVGAHALAAAAAGAFELDAGAARELAEWRTRFRGGLECRGFGLTDSSANFVLAVPPMDPVELVAALALRRIAVRSCASFGLPAHLRLAVRPPGEQERFFTALDEIARASRS